MQSVMEEVRAILDNTAPDPGNGGASGERREMTEGHGPESRNALDEAYELVRDHRTLVASLHRRADKLATAMGEAWRSVQLSSRTQRQAMESLRSRVLPALQELRDFVDGAIKHAEDVAGATGAEVPRAIADRLDQLDAGLLAMGEGRVPAPDAPPENAATNDYSADLMAATREAEDAIGAIRRLPVGGSVSVGRKKLSVSSPPTRRDNTWMVDLVSSPTGDAYTLVVSEDTVQLTRGDLVLEMTPADLYISEQYGDHMYGYGDYARHMSPGRKTKFGTVWIAPGDSVELGGDVFRVVDVHDSGALLQPLDTMKGAEGHTSLAGTQMAVYDSHSGQYTLDPGSVPGQYEMATVIQVVGHNPGDPKAVGEGITVDEFQSMTEASGSDVISKLKSIVKNHQAAKVDGVFMDATTANMLLRVYEALGEENRKKFAGLPIRKMVAIGWKLTR